MKFFASEIIDISLPPDCTRQREFKGELSAILIELEHVPPRLNRGIPLDWSMSESIGIDSLWGAGRWRGPILRT